MHKVGIFSKCMGNATFNGGQCSRQIDHGVPEETRWRCAARRSRCYTRREAMPVGRWWKREVEIMIVAELTASIAEVIGA